MKDGSKKGRKEGYQRKKHIKEEERIPRGERRILKEEVYQGRMKVNDGRKGRLEKGMWRTDGNGRKA